ncbi:hypothetical protein [Haloferula helveola]
MNTPNALQRNLRGIPSSPVPFRGSGKHRRPRRESGYTPSVKLVTGSVPSDADSKLKQLVSVHPVESELVTRSAQVSWVVGTAMGSVAALLVLYMWIEGIIGIVGQLTNAVWHSNDGGAFVLALYGVHLLGIPGAALARGRFQIGVYAIAAFWISVLGSIPIVYVLNQLFWIFLG